MVLTSRHGLVTVGRVGDDHVPPVLVRQQRGQPARVLAVDLSLDLGTEGRFGQHRPVNLRLVDNRHGLDPPRLQALKRI